jgi:hypothetical protein
MRPSRAQLRHIAEEVHDRLLWLYQHRFESVGWGHDLCGACAVASYLLFHRLTALGVTAKLVLDPDETHAFVMVGKVVLDPTATQHHIPCVKTVVGTHAELSKRLGRTTVQSVWKVGKVFDNAEEFSSALQGWYEEQQPVTYRMRGLI